MCFIFENRCPFFISSFGLFCWWPWKITMETKNQSFVFELYSILGKDLEKKEKELIYSLISEMEKLGYQVDGVRPAVDTLDLHLMIPNDKTLRNLFRRIVNMKKLSLVRAPIRLFTVGNTDDQVIFYFGSISIFFKRSQ